VLLALETLENRLVPSGVPTLSTGSLPADTVNVAYNQSIIASGGTGNVTLAVSAISNAIPGLSITGNGTGSIGISGTPTAVGKETFTVTGTDSAGDTTGPVSYSISVDPPLIVTSYVTNAVYEFDANNGALLATLVAPNSQSILMGPAAVTIGPDGNLYITGEGYNGSSFTGPYNITEYNFSTHTLSTFISGAQMQAANGGVPFAPGGIAFGPDGNLYTDNTLPGAGADQVIRFDITNNGGQLSYSGNSTTIATGLTTACDITFGANPGDQNNLYVSDDNSVLKITNATGASPTSSTFVSPGSGGLTYSCGLTWHGGILYDTDPGSGQVLEYSATGSFLGDFTGSALQNPNQQPINTLFLPDGNVVTSTFGPGNGFLVGTQGNEAGSLMQFNSNGQLLQNLGASAFPANAQGVTGVALAYMTFAPTAPGAQSTVTSVTPNTGPTTGGNVVTINGTFAGSGDTVRFGTTAATVTNDTTTSITAIAPAGAVGTVDVTVDGSAANPADKYTYVTPPSPPGSSPTAPPSVNASPAQQMGTPSMTTLVDQVFADFGRAESQLAADLAMFLGATLPSPMLSMTDPTLRQDVMQLFSDKVALITSVEQARFGLL
jgi:hypothetical protein